MNNIYEINDVLKNDIIKVSQEQDKAIIKFLRNEGYEITEPITKTQLLKIRKDLELKGLFVDTIEHTEYKFENNMVSAHCYWIPFLNSYRNPLTEETKNEILQTFIKSEKEKENANRKNI